jgi:acyl-CoA thioester hydrolase
MSVVYYANYLVWFEVARTDLLRHAGWTYREMEEAGFALPVIEAHCEYRQPARYDDELEVETTVSQLSGIRFDYRVVRVMDAVLLAIGHTVHVSLDPAGRPRRLPMQARAIFDEAQAGGIESRR